MSQAIMENVKMKRMSAWCGVRGAHPSKIAKGEAAQFVVAQGWASPLLIDSRQQLRPKHETVSSAGVEHCT